MMILDQVRDPPGWRGTGTGTAEVEQAGKDALEAACQQASAPGDDGLRPLCRWQRLQSHKGSAELIHLHAVRHLAWHGRGDYFSSVAPTGEDCR